MLKGTSAVILFVSCALSQVITCHAGNFETMNHLNALATDFISKNITVDPDERMEVKLSEAASELRLAVCNLPIAVSLPEGSAGQHINTLEMTCTGNPSWHVYVPVDTKIMTKVVMAKETIPARTEITSDMVEVGYHDKNTLYNGYFKDPSEIEGKEPLATLVTGTVLTKKNTRQPVIINRNQAVSIISRHGNIMVRADGVAKTNGALNESITVLNTSSKKVLEAVVINSSTVEVVS